MSHITLKDLKGALPDNYINYHAIMMHIHMNVQSKIAKYWRLTSHD
jgi:hypothetical protein